MDAVIAASIVIVRVPRLVSLADVGGAAVQRQPR